MKHQKQLLAVLLMAAACTIQAQRSEALLEKNWKFSKGDFKEASQPEFNDNQWESVVIPHDWAIFGPFDMNNDLQNVAVTQNFEKKASLKTGRTGVGNERQLVHRLQVRAGKRGSCQRRVRALRQRGRAPRQEPVDAQDHRLCR